MSPIWNIKFTNVTNIRSTKAFCSDFFFLGGGGQNSLKSEFSNFADITTAV